MEIKKIILNKKFIIGVFLLFLGLIISLLIFKAEEIKIKITEEIKKEIKKRYSETYFEPPNIPLTENEKIILTEFQKCLKGELKINTREAELRSLDYFIAKALIEKNEAPCEEIEDPKVEEVCLRSFSRFMIFTSGNENDCQGKKICLAFFKRDPEVCFSIENSLEKTICQAVATFNLKYCDTLLDFSLIESGELCRNISGDKGIQRCGIIQPKEAQLLCYKNVYLLKALKEKNLKLCEQSELKNDTSTYLICKVLLDPNPTQILEDFRIKNICYQKYAKDIAKIKNEPSVCEKIPLKESYNQQSYQECIGQFK